MWYWEEKTITGKWSPRTAPDEPVSPTISGRRIKIQNVREVPGHLQNMTPMQLESMTWADSKAPASPIGTIMTVVLAAGL
jgi:hypothetical protein